MTTSTLAAPTAGAAHQFITDVTSGRIELPVIPRVVQRLIVALRRQDVAVREIVDELSQDPVLSAKVLRLANSSYFGGRGSLASIDSAVSTVGTRALTTLIVACGISSAFVEVPGVNLRQFWSDALVSATAATRLAERLGADPDSAYVCGLMHATGHLMLCQAYPEQARARFGEFTSLGRAELAERELEAFGIAHPAVGGLWADRLGFPPVVGEAIRLAVQSAGADETVLAPVLRGACQLADAIARGDFADAAFKQLPDAVRARFGVAGSDAPDAEFTQLYAALQRVEPSL
jgi:HD-like signal output (HDOD) protein